MLLIYYERMTSWNSVHLHDTACEGKEQNRRATSVGPSDRMTSRIGTRDLLYGSETVNALCL